MSEVPRELVELLRNPGALEENIRRRLLEALLVPSEPHPITYDEFLNWIDEDSHVEWKEGKIVLTSPASLKHQEISLFLTHLIDLYVRQNDQGKVIPPPFQMKLENSGREPDLIYLATEHLGRLKDTYLDGPADLVVEITSPESFARDRGEKFTEYEQAGIPEYWLIDPQREQADFYRIDDQGRYHLVQANAQGIYTSMVIPGLWVNVSWFWITPPVFDALRAIGVTK